MLIQSSLRHQSSKRNRITYNRYDEQLTKCLALIDCIDFTSDLPSPGISTLPL